MIAIRASEVDLRLDNGEMVTVDRSKIFKATRADRFEAGTFRAWSRLYLRREPGFLSTGWLAQKMNLTPQRLREEHVIASRERRGIPHLVGSQPLHVIETEISRYKLAIYANGVLALSEDIIGNGRLYPLVEITRPGFRIKEVRLFGDLIIVDFFNADPQSFSLRGIIGPDDRGRHDPNPEPLDPGPSPECELLALR